MSFCEPSLKNALMTYSYSIRPRQARDDSSSRETRVTLSGQSGPMVRRGGGQGLWALSHSKLRRISSVSSVGNMVRVVKLCRIIMLISADLVDQTIISRSHRRLLDIVLMNHLRVDHLWFTTDGHHEDELSIFYQIWKEIGTRRPYKLRVVAGSRGRKSALDHDTLGRHVHCSSFDNPSTCSTHWRQWRGYCTSFRHELHGAVGMVFYTHAVYVTCYFCYV